MVKRLQTNNMLLSHPESNLNNNISVLGMGLVEILKRKNGYVIIETLLSDFSKKHRQASVELFFDALTFLFLLNLIEINGYKIRIKVK